MSIDMTVGFLPIIMVLNQVKLGLRNNVSSASRSPRSLQEAPEEGHTSLIP